MINWFRRAERPPEIGVHIVVISFGRLFDGAMVIDRENNRALLVGATTSQYLREDSIDYWAYASDFNFPKE